MRAGDKGSGRSHGRRVLRLNVERCEARELLSGLGAALTAALTARAAQVKPTDRVQTQAIEPFDNRILNPVGTPTRHQAMRIAFGAGYNGAYQVGPGRYSLEASQIYIHGKGGSSAFLHGDTQLRISVPTDPTIPATGIMTMFDKNRSSGSAISLDLTADPNSVDRFGRPARFSYVVDDNLSSGAFAAGQGQGTVQILYGPSRGRGFLQGPATVLVRGQVSSSGTTDPFVAFHLDY